MDLRKLLTFLIAPLLVTVAGGLIIYFYAKFVEYRDFDLRYQVGEPVEISADTTAFSSLSIHIWNNGTKTLSNLEIFIDKLENIEIVEYSLRLSSGPSEKPKMHRDGDAVNFNLESLRRNDTALFQLILRGKLDENLDVNLRSKEVVGTVASVSDEQGMEFERKILTLGILVALLVIYIFVTGFAFRRARY